MPLPFGIGSCGGVMKSRQATAGTTLAIVAGLMAGSVVAQQASVKRDFEAEIRTAIQSAKAAAGFEFLGTLVRTCLLPQSGGEDTHDTVPGYVTNPARAPASSWAGPIGIRSRSIRTGIRPWRRNATLSPATA